MPAGGLSDAAGGRRRRSSHREGGRHGVALGGEERGPARPRSTTGTRRAGGRGGLSRDLGDDRGRQRASSSTRSRRTIK